MWQQIRHVAFCAACQRKPQPGNRDTQNRTPQAAPVTRDSSGKI